MLFLFKLLAVGIHALFPGELSGALFPGLAGLEFLHLLFKVVVSHIIGCYMLPMPSRAPQSLS